MADFSERLKQLRINAGEKQADIAAIIGVSVQSLSSYEMGREPKYDVLCKMAKYFNVSTDYLLGISDYKNSAEYEEQKMNLSELEKQLNRIGSRERNILINTLINVVESIVSTKVGAYNTLTSIMLLDSLIGSYSRMINTADYFYQLKTDDAYMRYPFSSQNLSQLQQNIFGYFKIVILELTKDETEKRRLEKIMNRGIEEIITPNGAKLYWINTDDLKYSDTSAENEEKENTKDKLLKKYSKGATTAPNNTKDGDPNA